MKGYKGHNLLAVCPQSGQSSRVKQFHITNWSPDGSCSNLRTVTDVIEEVTKIQMRTENKPIVVHCRYRYYITIITSNIFIGSANSTSIMVAKI